MHMSQVKWPAIVKFCCRAAFWIAAPAFLAVVPGHAASQTIAVADACTSTGQLCSPSFSTTVNLASAGSITLMFTPNAAGCSKAEFYISVDGVQLAQTPFLAPGQASSAYPTATLSVGPHAISIQAQGEVGGCNEGALGSWGGSLVVGGLPAAAVAAAAAPIQPRDLALMTIGLALVAAWTLRQNRANKPA
jgi:hypothetical protein